MTDALKVLIAFDESNSSTMAAREAARFFAPLPDAEFMVVNVSTTATPWAGPIGYGAVAPLRVDPAWIYPTTTSPDPDPRDSERSLVEAVKQAGVPDSWAEVRHGDPVTQICAVADEWRADVIVVGAHDKSALHRLFDPSVSAGVIRENDRPVLVVSGTGADGAGDGR